MIYRAIEKQEEVSFIRESGHLKGLSTGFPSLDEIYTLKKGYPLFIAGSPHHGKTEFVFDLLINTSKMYGWKHFIYAGETGNVEDVIAELAHKYIEKPIRKQVDEVTANSYAMNDFDYVKAIEWINEHFFFLDSETDFTIPQFYEFVDEAEKRYDVVFDTTLIDPFNDVVEELSKYANREDKWLKDVLKKVRQNSKMKHRINILVNHIADIAPQKDNASNVRYTPIALPSEWAGGRTWHRRAFTMLLVYRPPSFMINNEGVAVAENESWIINQKAKPKGSGRLGKCSLLWIWQKNRYIDYMRESKVMQTVNRYEVEKDSPF